MGEYTTKSRPAKKNAIKPDLDMDTFLRKIGFSIRYLGKPPWDTYISPPELLEYMHMHPVGQVLDLGCGTGTNCLTMAKAGWTVTGVDLAALAVFKARRRFAAEHLHGIFLNADVTQVQLPAENYDLILDIGCYHSLPLDKRTTYVENVFRWLKPNGSLLLYGHMSGREGSEKALLVEEDIQRFNRHFRLQSRKDSLDVWQRRTVWLCFTKSG